MSANPEESLAPAAGAVEDDGVRELHPVVMWGKNGDEYDLYDFRGRPEPADTPEVVEEVDVPKASSAAGSALAAIYETLKTPDVDWSQSQVTIASAEKAAIPEPASESGSQTSSENADQKPGKTTPDAAT